MNPFEPRSTYNKRAHIIPAACPRHPSTVILPDAQLRLAVNEYRSCRVLEAGITLVLTHGTSFNKELWEPLIQQWIKHDSPLPITRVLALDAANHGDSAVLNEEVLGATSELNPGLRSSNFPSFVNMIVQCLNVEDTRENSLADVSL